MKDSDRGELDDDARERIASRPLGERWKSMPDGNAKRAAYEEQVRERERRGRASRPRPHERPTPG
jgi:hypothetical protein